MFSRSRELWYALAAILAVSAAFTYAAVSFGELPPASGLVGHGLGIVGFFLMLMTQTLYSARKLVSSAGWGSMQSWLMLHMVTGLVGPYLVLLHTMMRFHGLAGVTTLLTGVVVASGLVGRYVYGTIPRATSVERPGVDETVTAARLAARRRAAATWHMVHVPLTWALFAAAAVHVVAALYYATLQH